MAINIARYTHRTGPEWGVVKDDQITPISGEYPTTGDLISSVSVDSLRDLSGETLPLEEVSLLSPLTENHQFVCQGANITRMQVSSDNVFHFILLLGLLMGTDMNIGKQAFSNERVWKYDFPFIAFSRQKRVYLKGINFSQKYDFQFVSWYYLF